MVIRPATERDIPQLLELMKGLARFEEYIDSFGVTERHLLEQGFRTTPPDFHALVAHTEDNRTLSGMLVYYFVPFTALGRPTLYIKEVYVAEPGRSKGAGTLLMKSAARIAHDHGCGSMKWQVADWNLDAKRFYERLGAKANPVWVDFIMNAEAIAALDRAP